MIKYYSIKIIILLIKLILLTEIKAIDLSEKQIQFKTNNNKVKKVKIRLKIAKKDFNKSA